MWPSRRKILFQLTGSIAAYKACHAISRLVQDGHEVRTVASASALKFVGAATLEGLTGSPPFTDLFAAGQAMDHIHLARWADVMVLCPATANTINKLAAGVADDTIGALFLAAGKKPYLIYPAMNTAMWEHPITAESLKKLEACGAQILKPNDGRLACGEEGAGKLPEPDEILRDLRQALFSLEPTRARVLITSGGSIEPIDQVRHLGNMSSGRTAVSLAEELRRRQYEVTLLRAQGSERPQLPMKELEFRTFSDLSEALNQELKTKKYDFVIHAAAASDFHVSEINGSPQGRQNKISSDQDLILRLSRNPKLVDSLKIWSKNPHLRVVAFKLTVGESQVQRRSHAQSYLRSNAADAVVCNDLSEIKNQDHAYELLSRQGVLASGATKSDLARSLHALFESWMSLPSPPALNPEVSL